jgi:hypothetical protein
MRNAAPSAFYRTQAMQADPRRRMQADPPALIAALSAHAVQIKGTSIYRLTSRLRWAAGCCTGPA